MCICVCLCACVYPQGCPKLCVRAAFYLWTEIFCRENAQAIAICCHCCDAGKAPIHWISPKLLAAADIALGTPRNCQNRTTTSASCVLCTRPSYQLLASCPLTCLVTHTTSAKVPLPIAFSPPAGAPRLLFQLYPTSLNHHILPLWMCR